jgi:adenylate kinase family enzyme
MASRFQRVAILGPPGSGKSWLADEIGRRAGLPVVHLDYHYWRPNWVQPDRETWRAQVTDLAAGDAWVMDGSYSSTWNVRLPRADAIVYLDIGRWLCRWGVLRRTVKTYGRTRPDLGPDCPEQIDWKFIQYVWTHPWKAQPRQLATLEPFKAGRAYFHLRSRREVGAFLEGL